MYKARSLTYNNSDYRGGGPGGWASTATSAWDFSPAPLRPVARAYCPPRPCGADFGHASAGRIECARAPCPLRDWYRRRDRLSAVSGNRFENNDALQRLHARTRVWRINNNLRRSQRILYAFARFIQRRYRSFLTPASTSAASPSIAPLSSRAAAPAASPTATAAAAAAAAASFASPACVARATRFFSVVRHFAASNLRFKSIKTTKRFRDDESTMRPFTGPFGQKIRVI